MDTKLNLGEARSFMGLVPPNEAVEIAQEKHGTTTYYYYQDSEGKLYYETSKGYAFKREMMEAEKVLKIRKRMSKQLILNHTSMVPVRVQEQYTIERPKSQ